MNYRIAWMVLALTALPLVAGAPVAYAQDTVAQAENRKILITLQDRMELKDFQEPMTLREFLGRLYDLMGRRGKELPIIVDSGIFRAVNPDAEDVNDTPVQFDKFPKSMTIASALSIAVEKIKAAEGVFLVRNGQVEITTRSHAARGVFLNQKVMATFHSTPFNKAIEELAEATAVSIVIDNRTKDAIKAPITAQFRNDVALQDAVRMLAEMADLKLVHLPTGLFVTTPDHAQKVLKELKEQYRIDPEDPNSPLAPPFPPRLREAGA
jgi:hypothetical protein